MALIIPFVTDWPSPSALPMATTSWPSVTSSESPSSAIEIWLIVELFISLRLTATTAISLSDLEPFTVQFTDSPSTNVHFKLLTPSITCAFVRRSSSVSLLPTIIPVPLVVAS